MIKALPVSIVIASIVLPMLFANRLNAKKSLRLLQITMIAIALLWVLACVYLYPRYVLVE